MLKMDYNQILEKIKDNSGLSIEQIEGRIKQKMNQLSGLISKEGAAHIVANDLGVKLFEKISGKLQVKNILEGMRNVETVCKVQRVYEVREFQKGDKKGKVLSMLVGDETGSIRLVFWNEQVDKAVSVKDGDIVKVSNVYVRDNQGRKELHFGEKGVLEINPPGENVGEVKRFTSTRKSIKDLQENEIGVEIFGTIVQIFDIRFFEVCPNCGKRAKPEEAGFVCPAHGVVTPDFSYILNFIIDDGSSNIRAVCFRDQVKELVNKEHSELLDFRSNSEGFDDVKHELLGKIVKLNGRVSKNAMFDRLEFICQKVNPDPNPDDEIKNLQS